LRIFNGRDFITNVQPGDIVLFTIPKNQQKQLDTSDNVSVTSIESGGRIYLKKNEVLEIEKELATSNSDYFIGTMYLAAGLVVFFRRRFRQPKTTSNKNSC